jgi:hypothetical protein
MFGIKRWLAARARFKVLNDMFQIADNYLPGWKKKHNCDFTMVLRVDIPTHFEGSPMYAEISYGPWYYVLDIYYTFEGRNIKICRTFVDRIHDDITEPTGAELDIMERVYAIIQSMNDGYVQAKKTDDARIEDLRRKVVANLAYGQLSKSSVLDALK